MPHGFFTIEKWKSAEAATAGHWIPILNLDSYQSLTKAIEALEKRGEAGLYRIVQTQRCIWAEVENGKLRLHGSHVLSPENLSELVETFKQEGGRRPLEKAREERARVKAKRSRK
jgi:hypothetical protein